MTMKLHRISPRLDKWRLWAAMSVATLLWAATAVAAPAPLGPVSTTQLRADGADLEMADGARLAVHFLARDIVRLEAVPAGVRRLPTGAVVLSTPAAGTVTASNEPDRLILTQGAVSVIVNKAPLQVVVLRANGSVIAASLPGGLQHDPVTGTVVASMFARGGERYFGMGLAGGPLDRRGRLMTMRNADRAAYGEFTNPLYSSTPFFHGHLAGASYGLFFDNPTVAEFDFASRNGSILNIAAVGGTLNFYVMAGPTPAAVASAFAALTGSTPVPPRWAIGYQQAHFGYASAAQVLSLAREFRSRAIPADAFYLDLDYTDRLFTMSWNPVGWPDPVGFNAEMESLGFKRVNILEPLVTVFDPLWPWLSGNRWLATEPSGNAYIANIWMGDVSFIDFTKQGARDFFKSALKTFVSTGVSGIWADLNEPAANELPYAIFDFDGQPRYESATRNIYALWNVATVRDALLEAQPGLRPFIVSRSGFAGIQRYGANWSGDTDSTWDSLRVQVQIANSMGLSGQNFFGADVGGFLGAPDAELFVRWLQFGAATPYMRNHSMNTSPLREPWRYGEPYTSVARSVIEWRYRLMPYLYGLFVAAEAQGAPVLAPTYFHFPGDEQTHGPSGEFMLGDALMVAPVVERGAATRRLYLPAGSAWYDYHTDQRHAGGQQLTVAAPLQQLPMFARAGSILPMGPVRQFANQPVADESLVLDIFPGANGRFVMRDDDGATTAYLNGAHRDTELRWTETSTSAQLDTRVVGGQDAPLPRAWWLQVRAWPAAPLRVLADGNVLASAAQPAAIGNAGGWAYDAANRRLIVRMPGQVPAQTVRIERQPSL
jgi:alpha-glucosidase